MSDFIKLHRSITQWEWWNNHNTTRVFLYCLLRANWKDDYFQGTPVPRGSFITSYQRLAQETGLTSKQIRVALNNLKRTNEVAHEGHTNYSVVTIINYNLYQSNGTQEGIVRANEGQTKGKQRATSKNIRTKEEKNIKNSIKESTLDLPNKLIEEVEPTKQGKVKYGEVVTLTETEYNKIVDRYGKHKADDYIETVDLYCMSHNRTYKSYYATVLNFIKGDEKRKTENQGEKVTYTWEEELKAEQKEYDNKVYEPKRSQEETKKKWNEL
jgi:hypothetical protein